MLSLVGFWGLKPEGRAGIMPMAQNSLKPSQPKYYNHTNHLFNVSCLWHKIAPNKLPVLQSHIQSHIQSHMFNAGTVLFYFAHKKNYQVLGTIWGCYKHRDIKMDTEKNSNLESARHSSKAQIISVAASGL